MPSYPAIRDVALAAEAAGFDSVWVFDHLLYRFDGEETGIHECWTILSAIAEATSRVELGTIVMCTAFRNPALLAKMAATLDHVSGGRLILGVGAGWHEPEFEAFGFPFDHRVGRFEEVAGGHLRADPRGPGRPRRAVGHRPRRLPPPARPGRHADPRRRQGPADARPDGTSCRCLERWPGSGCPTSAWRAGGGSRRRLRAGRPRPGDARITVGVTVRYPELMPVPAEPPTAPGVERHGRGHRRGPARPRRRQARTTRSSSSSRARRRPSRCSRRRWRSSGRAEPSVRGPRCRGRTAAVRSAAPGSR